MTDDAHDHTEHDPLPGRVRALLADAIDRLDAEDRAERVAYCQASGEHGVRMHRDDGDDIIEFRWARRPLALVPVSVLLDNEPLPTPGFIAEPPNTVPDDWADQ